MYRTHQIAANVAESSYPSTFNVEEKENQLIEDARASRKMTRGPSDCQELTNLQVI